MRMFTNALTVDVEDYFHVTAFERAISRDVWEQCTLRVMGNVDQILDTFEEHKVSATFFILGWVAERLPDLAPSIKSRGHEIASHGFGHEQLHDIGPEAFRTDVRRAKVLLEDQCGVAVLGYRAPSFSITKRSLWALDILREEGFLYDSSIFPIRHDLYGMRDAPPHPHRIDLQGGSIVEFPLSTVRIDVLGTRFQFPVSGGGYLRFLPVSFIRGAFHRINATDRQPAVLYFHPWEIDPEQPRIRAGVKSRLRHYTNLGTTLRKVKTLLSTFRFAPMVDVLREQGLLAPPPMVT